MKIALEITPNLEPLFGTRDENLRLMEDSLGVRIDLRSDAVHVEGPEASGRNRSPPADGRPHQVVEHRSYCEISAAESKPLARSVAPVCRIKIKDALPSLQERAL